MYAKITKDKQLQIAGNPIRIVISNPTNDQLKFAGYKPVTETPQPEYNPETQYVTAYYEDAGDEIVQKWEVHEIEVVE